MLVADTHAHLYPAYHLSAALDRACLQLRNHNPGHPGLTLGLFLTERSDCFYHRGFRRGDNSLVKPYLVRPTGSPEVVVLSEPEKSHHLFVFAGRQIVTAEGLEVLCLTADPDIPDRQPVLETLDQVRRADGIPVLSWAPGKWFGRRGALIRSLIDRWAGEPLLLGDTSLRPVGWITPLLMRRGMQRGIPVVAGSDPLPFAGDESALGRYAIASADFDPSQPLDSARVLLTGGAFEMVGQRSSLPEMAGRWRNNQKVRSAAR
jgi:hypothetical protein